MATSLFKLCSFITGVTISHEFVPYVTIVLPNLVNQFKLYYNLNSNYFLQSFT